MCHPNAGELSGCRIFSSSVHFTYSFAGYFLWPLSLLPTYLTSRVNLMAITVLSLQCQFFNQESGVTLLPTTSTSASEPLMTTGDVLERVLTCCIVGDSSVLVI